MAIEVPNMNQSLEGCYVALKAPCTHFSCGGVQLSRQIPVVSVPKGASMANIHIALAQGKLELITEAEMHKRFDELGRKMKVEDRGDTGLKVFFTKKKGQLYVLTPRDEAHQKEIEAYLKEHGQLPEEGFTEAVVNGISGISVSDVEPTEISNIILTDAN